MRFNFQRWIATLYYLLFFLVPLVLFPKTSELFEFNKMVLTYALTVIIVAFWAARSISLKKFIFKRTLIDIPIIVFLLTQLLSTLISFDTRTSFFGYYSRFHGGLLSSLSYSLLYWAFVSNLKKDEAIKSIYSMIASSILVSFYGVLEHFGIDKDIWVQDVQNRVFSTLGQPNWLAAWLISLLPLTWIFALKYKLKDKKFLFWTIASTLLFLTLLYTKSRSGLLGFAGASVIFFIGLFYFENTKKFKFKKHLNQIAVLFGLIFTLMLVSGTQYTPGIFSLIDLPKTEIAEDKQTAPALEVGGSSSTEIRKIVWSGAINIWKNYPILGTGVETFAYSYYNFRPAEHNLVSEWDFLYNKAHNEYLNFLANTGAVGTLAYLTLILFTLIQISGINSLFTLKSNKSSLKPTLIHLGIFCGYVTILITNFSGFSVVPVALSFFIFPALAIALQESEIKNQKSIIEKLTIGQKTGIGLVILVTSYMLFVISRYWYADYLYAQGKAFNDLGNYAFARQYLQKAISISAKEPVYWEEISESTTSLAIKYYEDSEEINQDLIKSALSESRHSVNLSPNNVNLKRKLASNLISLSAFDPQLLIEARQVLLTASEQAPTDAKIIYNLGLAYIRTNELDKAAETLEKAKDLKWDYKNAHYALALVEIDRGNFDVAYNELNFIIEKIAPNDANVLSELEDLRQKHPELTN